MNDIESLKNKCLNCRACSIGGCDSGDGISNVFSNMNTNARIMIVGQNPGHAEVVQGLPLVGKSGTFFAGVIKEACGLEYSDLYITNVIKCLTPDGRKPKRDELEACQTFLEQEIAIVQPEVIISLGGTAFKALTGMSGVTKHQGQFIYSAKYKVDVLALMYPNPSDDKRIEIMSSSLKRLTGYLAKAETCG